MEQAKQLMVNILGGALLVGLFVVLFALLAIIDAAQAQNEAAEDLDTYSSYTVGGVQCDKPETLTAYQLWLCANRAPEVHPPCPAKPDGQVDYVCFGSQLGWDDGVYVGPPPTWPREVLEQEYQDLGVETYHSDLNRQGWEVRARQAEAALELLKKRCGRRCH